MPRKPVTPTSVDNDLADEAKRRGRQLRNSMPFVFDRTLVGESGAALVSHIVELVASIETRKRALKPAAAEMRRKTVNVLLANLAVAALNRSNPKQFVALPLNGNDYAGTGLSLKTSQLAFDALPRLGLAEAFIGRAWPDPVLGRQGMRSRIRATSALRDLMRAHDLQPGCIKNRPRDLIVLRSAAGPEPSEVSESRALLERVNVRLTAAAIELPEEAWSRLSGSEKPVEERSEQERRHRQHLGDLTAKSLYRVFTETWDQGGRLYGGWWMGIPKSERRHIVIDGEPTVELDYSQLHPTMLFALAGRQLEHDAYTVPGFSRELGKDTFMRLLNRTPKRGGRYIRRKGGVPLPEGITPAAYTELYKQHVEPIRHLLGEGMGLRLQRKDSDLAVAVLAELEAQQIAALPIHDSFIVQRRHAGALRSAMVTSFNRLCGANIAVK